MKLSDFDRGYIYAKLENIEKISEKYSKKKPKKRGVPKMSTITDYKKKLKKWVFI